MGVSEGEVVGEGDGGARGRGSWGRRWGCERER